MAWSTAVLAWSALAFPKGLAAAGQAEAVQGEAP
jgi:hypothetical protein